MRCTRGPGEPGEAASTGRRSPAARLGDMTLVPFPTPRQRQRGRGPHPRGRVHNSVDGVGADHYGSELMSNDPNVASASALAKRRKSARKDNSVEYQHRRQQLINAAAEVFHRKGFGETSLRDIAEQAGTDRTTLYYYVTSKQELFVEVIRGSLLDGVSAGERILASDATPSVRLRELLRALMLGYTEHYPYLFVWAQQDMSHLDIAQAPQRELAELAQRSYEIMREVVVEGLADGSFHSRLGPGVIAQTFIGAIARSSMWYTPDYDAAPEDLAEDLAALLVDGLTARSRRKAKKASGTDRTGR